ncbi:MAG TPA: adenylyltransferase/cytidyltransferase family protein [Candidatus Limnocylindrales bacterium]
MSSDTGAGRAEPTSADGHRDRLPLVVVSASFDSFGLADVRRLQAARRAGRVHVRVWSDRLVAERTGKRPTLPEGERLFLARSMRYVDSASLVDRIASAIRPVDGEQPRLVVAAGDEDPELRRAGERRGINLVVVRDDELTGLPDDDLPPSDPNARRVIVTGCYDWLHSGHVEFFHEAAALGELYVVVGSDRNVRLLKGPGHPLRGERERRYMAQAVRAVHRAQISTGHGWMDAEPEIATIRPHVYVVNEDGDQPEKREFCRAHGLQYVVHRRTPHRGLPRRTSTSLRGY